MDVRTVCKARVRKQPQSEHVSDSERQECGARFGPLRRSLLYPFSLAVCWWGEVQASTCPHTESRNQAQQEQQEVLPATRRIPYGPCTATKSQPTPPHPSYHHLAQDLNLGAGDGGGNVHS